MLPTLTPAIARVLTTDQLARQMEIRFESDPDGVNVAYDEFVTRTAGMNLDGLFFAAELD